jgi:hypothetical protein
MALGISKNSSNHGDKWKENFEKVKIRWMFMLEPLNGMIPSFSYNETS